MRVGAPGAPGDWRPNLFVPGFGKCGTTALCDYLGQHPDVYVTDPKEPQTLSIGLSEPVWIRRHGRIVRPYYRYLTPSEYRRQLEAHSGYRYRVDGSQTYVISPAFPRRLREFAPGAKLLFMIREQKERLLSLYYFMFKVHREPVFLDWIRESFSPDPEPFMFTRVLESYHRLFGESMRVIDNATLLRSPGGVMSRVFAFLGLGAFEVEPTLSNVGGMRGMGESQRRRAAPYLRVTQELMSPYNYFLNSVDPAGRVESMISVARLSPLARYRRAIFRRNPREGAARQRNADEWKTIPEGLASKLDTDYASALGFAREKGVLLAGDREGSPS